jgi:ABC-type polysaccharide/polyol phosphate transport system ATPase subunit
MSDASPAITVEDVAKRYRLYHERNQSLKAAVMRRGRVAYEEFWALKGVSLEIPEGETFGLIGENGSGKSTLLKCMTRIIRPDRGRITVRGKVSALLELGAGFHPELSGRENVYLNGSILGLSKRELDRKFDEIVDFAGLDRFIDTPVKNYSSGMYVRLGFSVAINVDPDVLLVDEVLAVGDEQFQRKCNEKFADLKSAGRTIVIVSHALGSVRNLCHRVAWLEHGEMKEIGPAAKIVDKYVGDVHTDREVDGDHGSRWGSGEARVDRIELIGSDGRATTRVRTGDSVIFRMHYSTKEPVERPVFGVAIHTLEGSLVTGPNAREGGCVPDRLSGSGHVDLRVEHLMLLPGTYDLTVSLTDYSFLHPFDFRYQAFRFDVESGVPNESHGGVVSLGGTWHLDALDPAR